MTQLTIPLAIGLGGFIGALLRFYVSGAVGQAVGDSYSFTGTLTVNLIGCLLIGILWTITMKSEYLSPVMQKCLITGLLGSLTTFSTFALESLNLLQAGHVGAAILNISVNAAGGILLVWLGMMLANTFIVDASTAG